MNLDYDAPFCWEQKVLLAITTPIHIVGIPLGMVLKPIYILLGALRLPLLLVILVTNAVWALLMGVIAVFCRISLRVPQLRPLSFLLALPFLILGDVLVTISPVPSPADAETKMVKWRFIEKFPYSLRAI